MSSAEQQALLMAVAASSSSNNDPFWSNVVLLMGFEGPDGSTGAPGMNDESPSAHGTAAQINAVIDVSQFKFGTSSLHLVGTGDINFPDSNDFNLANNQFTVECFVRFNSIAGQQFFIGQWPAASNLGWVISTGPTGTTLSWNVSTTGVNNITVFDATWGPSTGVWYHIAIDWNGVKTRGYVNGVMVGSDTTARTIFDSPALLAIGSNAGNSAFRFNGWMDELRITKGVARYANDSGFTVPAVPFPRHA